MAPEKNDSALQAIHYQRGSLQLLDQRKLPLETIYMDILDSKDGWYAIRDMVVRGAPAIAVAGALSLAVEIFNLGTFDGTSEDAASLVTNKLEYLLSSRPTAVNLSDAATKLKEVVSKAAATSSEAMAVFQAYIEAAEVMLTDDVASNKAIGSYGASLIQNQLKHLKMLSILTHCNTGSLATAGYGTALGVIRALHDAGVLERAYCTETRPFNQCQSFGCKICYSGCMPQSIELSREFHSAIMCLRLDEHQMLKDELEFTILKGKLDCGYAHCCFKANIEFGNIGIGT
ncbi:Methylthioribose-1-phosphate isomerase [Actinidia chinensis var. chinensis]|uniref:Methylthioribose-1-phosphate isomerase n=1 Tax=Actinidia chinensis var. chinensis TaxID=1590841 RepID=A0A2R6Q586_ACTCC|nr:Methylthioribose-1-phosphate isomerase [Actinidia chinensis var. chinensis]